MLKRVLLVILAAALGGGLGTFAAPTLNPLIASELKPYVEAKLLRKEEPKHVAATPPAPQPVELAQAEVFRVAPATLRFTIPFSGTLTPLRQATVKAQVAAPVAEVVVQEGEAVRKGDVLVRIDVSDLQSALEERTANLEGARAQLTLAQKNRDAKVKLASKGYAARQTVNEVEAAFDAAEAAVRAAEAQLDVARKGLAKAEVKAPMDGVVAERNVNPGDKVAIDGKLLTIVSLSEMEINAPVPASEIGQVVIGQPVSFRVPGIEARSFTGTVARINPMVRPGTRSIPVYISVGNAEGLLRGGMFAAGEIVLWEDIGVLAIPREAVRGQGAETYVLKVARGRLLRQPVRAEMDTTLDLVAVISGLAAGDTILAAAAIDLPPETPVRVSQR